MHVVIQWCWRNLNKLVWFLYEYGSMLKINKYCACATQFLFNNDVILVKVKITRVHISCSTRLHIYVIRIKRVVMITSNLRPFLLNWKYTVAVKFSIYTPGILRIFFLYFHSKKKSYPLYQDEYFSILFTIYYVFLPLTLACYD